MPRILFAGLFHETHNFVDETTGPDAFRRRDAADIPARCRVRRRCRCFTCMTRTLRV